MVKIDDRTLPELANIYNNKGKVGLYKHLRETYGIKQPWCVLSRMKKSQCLDYESDSDMFLSESSPQPDENLFMTMDELCSPMKPQHIMAEINPQAESKEEAMEKLIKNLIGDRLLELSRYVIMDPLTKTMRVDKTSLDAAGYTLITH